MEAGVLSPVVGTIGTLQATEAIKSLLGLDPDQVALTLYDAQTLTFKTFKIAKYTHCKICQHRT
jgi:adenylyltransferase/sulfurtransferase